MSRRKVSRRTGNRRTGNRRTGNRRTGSRRTGNRRTGNGEKETPISFSCEKIINVSMRITKSLCTASPLARKVVAQS